MAMVYTLVEVVRDWLVEHNIAGQVRPPPSRVRPGRLVEEDAGSELDESKRRVAWRRGPPVMRMKTS
jgi:hypothetical protein